MPLRIRGIRKYGCTSVYGIHVGVGVSNNAHLRTTKFSHGDYTRSYTYQFSHRWII